jgi:2-methylcitrate dehydratase PrpD
MSSLTRSLTRAIRALPVSGPDRRGAERMVRDWVGSRLAGEADPVGRRLTAARLEDQGLERRVFLAAAHAHVTETDDLHRASVTHPGCVVISTAWEVSSHLGKGGHALLDAVLAGYEAMVRVGEALGPGHYRLFHTTATAGVFGAAAATAHLLELDEDPWVWALGNAGTQAAGLWQFNEEGAMTKPLHAGQAAAAGLRAALLARQGFTGPERILEGEKGLFRALCPDPEPEAVLAPASGWRLHETSLKPYPCCRHTHPAIDAALALRGRLDGEPGGRPSPDRIARIRVGTYPAALDVTDRPLPRSPQEARFSLQYAVVVSLLTGRPGPTTFHAPLLGDLRVRSLLERTRVAPDPALAEAYPERWGAEVELELVDGTRFRELRRAATGDPELPLEDAALDAKVSDLLGGAGVGGEACRALLANLRGLEGDGPLPELPGPR